MEGAHIDQRLLSAQRLAGLRRRHRARRPVHELAPVVCPAGRAVRADLAYPAAADPHFQAGSAAEQLHSHSNSVDPEGLR